MLVMVCNDVFVYPMHAYIIFSFLCVFVYVYELYKTQCQCQ